MRKGKFISTYSNIQFWPLEPKNEEVKIVDIAHALSMLCRGNGHLKHFYSVGQHSIYCALEAKNRALSTRIQMACLLHDASEAYLSDVTRPVKSLLPEYLKIEEKLQTFIYEKFKLDSLTEEELNQMKKIDDDILLYELKVLMGIDRTEGKKNLSTEYDSSFKMMNEIEEEFLNLFKELESKL